MTLPHPPLREPLASAMTAALISLAALTQRAAYATFVQLDAISYEMLKHVLALSKAQRGAILLSEGYNSPRTHEQTVQSTPVPTKACRTLALHNIQEEEAAGLLHTFPAANAHIHSAEMTCWITYSFSLNEAATEDSGDTGNGPGVPPVATADDEGGQQAVLLLGWPSESDEACASMVADCQMLLHLVADSIKAVVGCIVLRERMQELERTSVRESLQGMDLLKAELLGTVSHELRGPLASIKGYAATLLRHERRLGREERHQFLLAISQASDRLEVIIERLLEISQLETGQVRIDRAPVDVAYLAGEAIAAIKGRVEVLFPGRFVFSLHFRRADGAAAESVPTIEADQRRLREVLDNLLENAVDYSPAGGKIDVTLRPVVQIGPLVKSATVRQNGEDSAGTRHVHSMLEICVSDSGQGIPVEHLERIFERFHRVDTRLTREVNGLGLGLTICKHIVELHDGKIWAENRPHGMGAAFYVRLPLDEDVDESFARA